jgi:hypothetical protein
VAPEQTAQQKAAKLQSKQKPNGFSPMFDKPKLDIRYPDLPAAAQVQVLGLAGVQVTEEQVREGPPIDINIDRNDAQGNTENQPPPLDPNAQQITPDHLMQAHAQTHDQALKEDQQVHQQAMDQAKLQLEAAKVGIQAKDSQTKAKVAAKPTPKPAKPAVKGAK